MSKSNETAEAVTRLANSISPNISGGQDAAGGYVTSLTEAVMGITAGLVKIATAIDNLASAHADLADAHSRVGDALSGIEDNSGKAITLMRMSEEDE